MEGGINTHGMSLTLNNPLTVSEGMNYIKLRMYVESSAFETFSFWFLRSDRASFGPDASGNYNDATASIATNKWTSMYVDVSKLAVDGKIEKFYLAAWTNDGNAKIYLDYVAVVEDTYELGQKLDVTGFKRGSEILSSAVWNASATSEIPAGAELSQALKLSGGIFQHTVDIDINNPISVAKNMNYIKVHMYVESTSDTFLFQFMSSDNTGIDGSKFVSKTIASNSWQDVYLDVSKFAVDGKINGFFFLPWTQDADAVIYINYIAITNR